jgi:hypothetical protein
MQEPVGKNHRTSKQYFGRKSIVPETTNFRKLPVMRNLQEPCRIPSEKYENILLITRFSQHFHMIYHPKTVNRRIFFEIFPGFDIDIFLIHTFSPDFLKIFHHKVLNRRIFLQFSLDFTSTYFSSQDFLHTFLRFAISKPSI